MVDSIQNVAAVVEQDPHATQAGQVDREKGSEKDKAPRGAAEKPKRKVELKVPPGNVGEFSEVVKDINTLVHQVANTKISFDVDEDTGRAVVRVLNKETGEIIRQVPPEELLTLVARMRQLSGLIFSQEV
ncbi:MAG: flagellar protein FlaG [Fidelibacterota bacterium]|nr:MAG: flagellar protein FlaG [Candidatus Neomarinimicrobiota bacterium]